MVDEDTQTAEQKANRVAVVTGASSGLGRIFARVLLERGHRVALAGRRADQLDEAAADHLDALVVPTDVREAEQVGNLFDATCERFGRIDVLINNAGVFGPAASVDELEPDDWDSAVATNLTGSMLCAREAMRRMKEQRPQGGRIINNGSLSAMTPRPRSAAYTVTKHAITGLTRSIALDGRGVGIACTQLDIGNAATAMTSDLSVEALQPDGSRRPEATFDPVHVASMLVDVIELPLDVSVPNLTIMAREMPFYGRG